MSTREGWASPTQQGTSSHEKEELPELHQTLISQSSHSPKGSQPINSFSVLPGAAQFHRTAAPHLPTISAMDSRSTPNASAHHPSPSNQQQAIPSTQMQHPSYPLPTIQNSVSHSLPPQGTYDRDREMMEARDRELRDQDMRNRESRDRAIREHDMRDPQSREQHTPHQTHAEPPQLHQPVALVPPRAGVHGPNGLLNNGALGVGAQSQQPATLFANQYDRAPAGITQAQMPTPGMISFPGNPQNVAPGQQPILNDALSYLDQVKVQFSGEPNVYNQFLDIMKDFKSQAIDTPGVIRRVSQLFQGNPNLIQGFNTFLPPGYRIECGTADDPNAIRVTTPMGTMVSPMGTALLSPPERRPEMDGAPASEYDQLNRDGNYIQMRNNVEQHGVMMSPSVRAQNLSAYGQPASRLSPFDPQAREPGPTINAALIAHQQEQRGVSQLQSAVSAATGEMPVRHPGLSPMPESATPVNGSVPMQQSASGVEKRGPVEFNHAISYVNKIKNRFSNQPEIYKQFLEILQTYQRESKPIQDVYAQVTQLFHGAQDLLEDFKQFLPESAAHAKAQAAKQAAEDATQLSNLRGSGSYEASNVHSHPTPRPDRMPPLGNFATTPSAGRDGKRKRNDRNMTMTEAARPGESIVNSKTGLASNKRLKQQHQTIIAPPHAASKILGAADGYSVSPSLVPSIPEPMPPSISQMATSDELAFFDKVKKFIGPRSTMNEFLKLCNLYSQDLIDKNLLVKRAESYIGSSPDLFNWFKVFVGFDGQDHVIENRAREVFTGRVNLNNCRSLGQSYRQMPKRERNKTCSGRDEMCRSVLNDEWVSHPTWASEDSGFIAHRKNIHEEGLHRIEEERHDYDLHIANIERTIQILEPLAQQAQTLRDEDKKHWTLPTDFGGQSQAIHKKVIAKVYGRERALSIMEELIRSPARVVPVLLIRFRLIAEQWKASQREWDKVWRDQTQRMFWRSLDHQGVSVKASDKRQFQTKTLCQEILVKYEEQKKSRQGGAPRVATAQLGLTVDDKDVLHDAAHLLLTYAEQQHSTDFPRLIPFIKEFIPTFFGIPLDHFQARIAAEFDGSMADEEEDEDVTMQDDSSGIRGRKSQSKKAGLLRDVLGKTQTMRTMRSDNVGDSRGSTPDVNASNRTEEETHLDGERASSVSPVDTPSWVKHAVAGASARSINVKPNEPYERTQFNLYANTSIYCFFRMFIILYDRLSKLKANEKFVHESVKRAKAPKAAIELGMADKHPDLFFADTSPGANYYRQVLMMLEEFVKGDLEMAYIEEVLRRYYLQSGWMLYTFDRLMSALVRFAISILGNDGKDKSWDILQLFQKDRKKNLTTHQEELQYRKQVEKLVREGDIYKIIQDQSKSLTTIRVLRRDDLSFELDEEAMQTPEQRWRAYVSSYVGMQPTEGVILDDMRAVLLERNIAQVRSVADAHAIAASASAEALDPKAEELSRFDKIKSHEGLALKIGVDDYRITWDHEDEANEWWIADPVWRVLKTGLSKSRGELESTTEKASGDASIRVATDDKVDGEGAHQAADSGSRFDEKFVMNNIWMKGLTKDQVDAKNEEFRGWRAVAAANSE